MVLPDPFGVIEAWRHNSLAMPQGLDQRLKIEVGPNMAHRRGSDTGQSRDCAS